ncbi:MAG TPA: hypothetical protein VM241_00675 [Candidatus Thermoplasmatota archaeon]|jgi:hypothetical protein|nr:hypothetical protein [Candidatus Thermoplasmatota archaeon]
MDTALTVMAVFAVVALAAAGAAAFYSWSRRNRTFERPVRRAGAVVERPGEPVAPRASGRTVEEEHYSRTVQERGAPPRAYAGEGSLDDDARRPPM